MPLTPLILSRLARIQDKLLPDVVLYLCLFISYRKKYLQSDWLRRVQYCPYLYTVFKICTLLLNKQKNSLIEFRNGKIETYSLKTN